MQLVRGVDARPETMRTLQLGDDWIEEREGGLGRYYYELLRHLPATGTGVQGLVVGSEKIAASTGGLVVGMARPGDSMLKRLRAARRHTIAAIKQNKIDLIVPHFALYGFPILDQMASTPSVVHFHGPWAGESDVETGMSPSVRFKSKVERLVYSRARRLIVLSRSFQQELVRRYGVSEDLIRIVPGGIDIHRFNMDGTRAEAREKMGWPLDRPILLTVRRQVRRMGLEDLIDATVTLIKKQPDLLVLLGGSGPIAGELKTRIESLGLQNNVRLLGRVSDADLPTAYRAADMTVVPSQSLEGFGLITLESLAAGTPVFVTPVGGLPEIILPFAPECVFADTSSAEIARVLGEALDGSRPLPSEAACRAYAEEFSWPRIAERVRKVYDEAVG